jgi:DNA-binding LacI/PurR family transcriptional regulator
LNQSTPIRPTIKDVARAAKVSPATVSYVLSDSRAAGRISPQTKKRVLSTVERLWYRRNPVGRDLQRGHTDQIVLMIVTWDLTSSHAATAMAISRAAAQQGLALTVHVADDDSNAETLLYRHALHHLSGVLVLWDSPAFSRSSLRRLAAEGLPVIDLLPGSPDGISVVTADREDAAYRATRHLLELGHRQIGLIGDTLTRAKTTLRKLAGYRRALKDAGIGYQKAFVQNVTEFGFEGGQRGVRQLLGRCPDVTGLFCINDQIALGAMDAANDLGRACPAQFSVIGFGDSAEGRHWRPKLTTFALSAERVASEAIQLVLEQRRAPPAKPKTILIPEDLLPKGVNHRLGFLLSDGYGAMNAHPVVQRGICALASAKPHACGDPFERQGGLAPHTHGDDRLARLVFRARRQVTLAPHQAPQGFFASLG